MRRGPPAMPTVSTSACGYAGGAWAIFGQMPAHSNVATPSLSAHPAHALLAAHGTAGFSGAAALFATVSTAPYCQPTSLLQRYNRERITELSTFPCCPPPLTIRPLFLPLSSFIHSLHQPHAFGR
ncbi:hypothetical protein niasHT_011934 [Heterodera trifolii]|uniref:Uncharacterized protein n=1 Tax=Heterodera trifolii TaxID=157864 RepID=A0ABD2KX75_9BILA